MSFADPASITHATLGTISLPRVSVGEGKSVYSSADGSVKVTAANAYGRRTRRTLRVDQTKVAPDPFRPAENTKSSMSYYVVFDHPPVGFSTTEVFNLYGAFAAFLSDSSSLRVTKLIGGES